MELEIPEPALEDAAGRPETRPARTAAALVFARTPDLPVDADEVDGAADAVFLESSNENA